MYKPVSTRKKISYKPINQRKKPFDSTKVGVGVNAVLGINQAGIDVMGNLFQKGKELVNKGVKNVIQSSKEIKNLVVNPREEIAKSKVFGKNTSLSASDFGKIENLAIGFSGGLKPVNGITDDIARIFAKETSALKIEQKLVKMGVEAEHAKGISPLLSKAKNINEVKQTLVNYGVPKTPKKPLNEIFALEGEVKPLPTTLAKKKDFLPLGKTIVDDANGNALVKELYHVTPTSNLESIKKFGLSKNKGNQNFEERPRNLYFADDYDAIQAVNKSMARNGTQGIKPEDTLILRYKPNELLKTKKGGIFYDDVEGSGYIVDRDVSPDKLEMLTDNGWKPLVSKPKAQPKPVEVKYKASPEFFNKEIEKWTKSSSVESRQNAYDYIMKDAKDLGKEMRVNQFGSDNGKVTVYRSGNIRDGLNSFFPKKEQAISYAKGGNVVNEYTTDIKNIVPTNSGAGELVIHSDDLKQIKPNQLPAVVQGKGFTLGTFDKSKKLTKKQLRENLKKEQEDVKRIQENNEKMEMFRQAGENRFPVVINGESFTMGPTTFNAATRQSVKTELKATQKEIKNAQIANEKALKLEEKEQKIRTDALNKIQRFRGNAETIKAELKDKNLSPEDIDNIVLENGMKLNDVAKVKRNPDGSLSTVITKKELDDISKNYTDEVPKQKWEKKSMLVDAKEIPINLVKSIELPYSYFERKGLSSIYDQVIDSQRDAEVMRNRLIGKFQEAGLYKEGGWFTPNRFDVSKEESKGIAEYYLGRQGHGKEIPVTDLSEKSQQFVKVFDEIIAETTQPFYEVARNMGKNPGVIENYAPIMTREDIKLVDQGGGVDWLFRKHPAFFSLKERVKNAPKDVYEKDYRKVANRWIEGITQFITMGDTTNHLKYLTNSDEFRSMIKEKDLSVIDNWLKDITTPHSPSTLAGSGVSELSKLLRKGTAIGSLGLNYATILKQALTQIPIAVIEKSLPKMKSEYAKAFGIDVSKLPSISKRTGDIAISDIQGKVGRIFTGGISEFDKINAQAAINGLLDKEYKSFLKEGAEITPDIRKLIEKNAQDKIDMWFGGFFKGQRPEAYREELGNFILMFTYPLTSQLNGFFRHIFKAKGFGRKSKAIAEVLAATVAIAYMEKTISNLSPEWSDTKQMSKDVLVSLLGNLPMVGDIAYSISSGQDMSISPVIGSINNIVRNISEGKPEKVAWSIAETAGLPKQVRKVSEGMEIMEEGGITDNSGKMLAPVQGTMEYLRAFLRGKYGPLAAQDYVRNIGVAKEDRRWFIPQVEFLQNGNYDRKAELYKSFDKSEQKELYNFLSKGQKEKLDGILSGKKSKSTGAKKSLSDIFN